MKPAIPMGHTPAAPRFPSTDTPSVRRRRHPGLRRAGYVLAGALVAFVVAASFASSGSATPRTAAFWSTYCTGHPHTANRHCVLTAPTGLTATRVTASGATLAWKRVRGASGYAVFAGGSAHRNCPVLAG